VVDGSQLDQWRRNLLWGHLHRDLVSQLNLAILFIDKNQLWFVILDAVLMHLRKCGNDDQITRCSATCR
jgi:hypothetical protein